jgi:hypothetical protein
VGTQFVTQSKFWGTVKFGYKCEFKNCSIGLCTADRLGHEGAKLVISSRLQAHVDEAIEHLVHSGIPRENVCGTVCHVGKFIVIYSQI